MGAVLSSSCSGSQLTASQASAVFRTTDPVRNQFVFPPRGLKCHRYTKLRKGERKEDSALPRPARSGRIRARQQAASRDEESKDGNRTHRARIDELSEMQESAQIVVCTPPFGDYGD